MLVKSAINMPVFSADLEVSVFEGYADEAAAAEAGTTMSGIDSMGMVVLPMVMCM